MQLKETRDALNYFGKYVVAKSRQNLVNDDKSVSGSLYNSLEYNVDVQPSEFTLSFFMEDYGMFQDQGVKGKSSSFKAPRSPFQFGTGSGKKGGLTQGIDKWVRRKRFQFRDRKSGRFLSYQSTAFLITRSIYHKGIKPSLFFTKPFQAAFKDLDKEILRAYEIDVTRFLEENIKK